MLMARERKAKVRCPYCNIAMQYTVDNFSMVNLSCRVCGKEFYAEYNRESGTTETLKKKFVLDA